MTIEEIKENKLLAYEYVRGSTLYNTNLPDGLSDVDYGGVYIAPLDVLYGLSYKYEPQVSDKKGDTTYYELGRWVELLIKANPNALESLYVPTDKIIGEIHPSVQLIIDNRDLFLTKEVIKSTSGYARSQIHKATGHNNFINVDKNITYEKSKTTVAQIEYSINFEDKNTNDENAVFTINNKYCQGN